MEALPRFQVLRPATAAEAVAAHADNPAARYVAGGTDLVVNIRRGIEKPETVIDLGAIEEMAAIHSGDSGLRIGAGVTLERVETHPDIVRDYPLVAEAARAVAGPSHRAVGTLGGNLCLDTRCVYYNQSEWWRKANDYCLKHLGDTCHVAPSGNICHACFSGDVAPALLVLDATVEIAGAGGTRTVPLPDLYRDDGRDHLRLEPGELLVAVNVPKGAAAGARTAYEKVRVRGGIDFPLAGVAMVLRRDGDAVADLRVGLTGTNTYPVRLDGTEALLGRPLDDDAVATLEKLVQKAVQPMRTTFTAMHYRRKVALNVTGRLARRLYEAG